MSKNQSGEYRIPIVVGEYDSATRDKGLSRHIGRAVVSAASRVVMAGKKYAERIGVNAKRPENDKGLMGKLGFPGNPENPTGASEGSTDTSKPGANESKTEKRKANDSGESATLEDSNEGKEMKSGDNPEGLTPYEQAMRDKYLGDEYDEAEYGDDKPEKNERVEDLNSEDATYVDDTPTEKIDLKAYEAATNLKIARSRFAKASVAVESHFFKKFFGGKKRQEELNAATEELKKCELEDMRLKFADKIEAAKQDPEKQAELAAEMAQAAFASMQETSRMTTDKYDNMLDDRGKFKKAAAKVGEWFTKGGKVSQWLKLGGAGFAVGTTTVAFAGWPITTATLVATKLAVAGALKQNILEERRGEDRIAKDRPDYLDSSFAKDMAGKEADYVMNRAVDMSVDELKDVSVKRQEDLYRRIGSGLVKYTIGFGLGGLAGNWLSSTYATGNSVPQSGSEAVDANSTGDSVPQSGSGAVDTGVPTPEAPNVPEINFDSYDYPWDWAAEKFGDANAMDQLHNLADKAMANGHTVEWFNNPDGSVWMKVDGSSATADVLKVLNKYV